MEDDGLSDILNPDPAAPPTGSPADSPAPGAEGESLDQIVASVEAELAGQAPQVPHDPNAPAAPAPDTHTIEKLAKTEAELVSLRALVESQMAPPDPEAEGKALEQQIRADNAVVECNREIETIEKDQTDTRTAQVALLRDIGAAQDQAAHWKGAASVAADDLKPGYEAKASAAELKVSQLQTQYSQNASSLKQADRDLRSAERRLGERVEEIQSEASSRATAHARSQAIARVTVDTFNTTVDSTAKSYKVDLNPFHKSMIRAGVTMLMRRAAPDAPPWTPEQTRQVTAAMTRKFMVSTGMTAGARAVALSPSKAPSAPRPASQRVAAAPPQSARPAAEQAALESDPNYWRQRATKIVERGGLQAPRRS